MTRQQRLRSALNLMQLRDTAQDSRTRRMYRLQLAASQERMKKALTAPTP